MAFKSKWHKRQEQGTEMLYCESVNQLLQDVCNGEYNGRSRRLYGAIQWAVK